MIISLVFLNKKRKKNHSQNKIKFEKQIIKKLCELEAKILDFYDYKKHLKNKQR